MMGICHNCCQPCPGSVAGSSRPASSGSGSPTQRRAPRLSGVQLHALHAVRPLREDFLQGAARTGGSAGQRRRWRQARLGAHPTRHRRRARRSPGGRRRPASPLIAAGSLHRRPTLMSSRSGCRQGGVGGGAGRLRAGGPWIGLQSDPGIAPGSLRTMAATAAAPPVHERSPLAVCKPCGVQRTAALLQAMQELQIGRWEGPAALELPMQGTAGCCPQSGCSDAGLPLPPPPRQPPP